MLEVDLCHFMIENIYQNDDASQEICEKLLEGNVGLLIMTLTRSQNCGKFIEKINERRTRNCSFNKNHVQPLAKADNFITHTVTGEKIICI